MSMPALWRFARDVFVKIALPFVIYNLAQPHFGDVKALLASSVPPILWSLVEVVRRRRIDALSALALAGIALSLIAYFGGGSVQFLQFREKLVTILIALVFLASVAFGRPLMHEIIRAYLARTNPSDLKRVESLRGDWRFRRAMTIMTLVWGAGLFADAAVSIALVYVVPIATYLVVNPILGYATIGGLTLWTLWFGRTTRRAREARMAGAEPPKSPPSVLQISERYEPKSR